MNWRKALQRVVDWLCGRKLIYGRDWKYTDYRKDKVIGYICRSGELVITCRETWNDVQPDTMDVTEYMRAKQEGKTFPLPMPAEEQASLDRCIAQFFAGVGVKPQQHKEN